MDQSDHEIKATLSFISIVIKCLQDAVGDDIKEDIKTHRLVTQNSTQFRIWDLINTNICSRFNKSDVIANPTKRGPWELVPVFERSTGIIYSLMREQRFSTLRRALPHRRIAHYIDAFVRSFNKELIAPQRQIPLLPVIPILPNCFNDEDHIHNIVQRIISDLGVPNELIRRHALILFRSFNFELTSVRCCIVDSNLEIVNEADWSNYIKASDGMVVDEVIDKTSTYADPTAGLKYKQKAKDKMGQKALQKGKKAEEESDDIS
jgi:ribosomal protein L12E/L44/L45/RPP1/RPP2